MARRGRRVDPHAYGDRPIERLPNGRRSIGIHSSSSCSPPCSMIPANRRRRRSMKLTTRTRSPETRSRGVRSPESGCEIWLRAGPAREDREPRSISRSAPFLLEKPTRRRGHQLPGRRQSAPLSLLAAPIRRGRRTSDMTRAGREYPICGKQVAEENQCFDQPYASRTIEPGSCSIGCALEFPLHGRARTIRAQRR